MTRGGHGDEKGGARFDDTLGRIVLGAASVALSAIDAALSWSGITGKNLTSAEMLHRWKVRVDGQDYRLSELGERGSGGRPKKEA